MLIGTEAVRDGLRRGKVGVVVVAADRSRRVEDKVTRLARRLGIPGIAGPDSEELGRLLGKGSVSSVAVR